MTLKEIAIQAFEHFDKVEILEECVLIDYDTEYRVMYDENKEQQLATLQNWHLDYSKEPIFIVHLTIGIVPYFEHFHNLTDAFKYIKCE